VREEFLPGPTAQVTIGPLGELEATPMYALYVNVAAETGLTAKRYVDALRVLFAPRTAIRSRTATCAPRASGYRPVRRAVATEHAGLRRPAVHRPAPSPHPQLI
jgi:hypothetical protein